MARFHGARRALFRKPADVTTGLKAYWVFNEGSGTSAADSSGNGHTATLDDGTPTTGNWSSDGTGNYYRAANGGVDLAQIADHADFAPGTAFTVFAWAFQSTVTASSFIVAQYDFNNNGRSWLLGSDDTTGAGLRVSVNDSVAAGGNVKNYYGSQTAFTTNTWQSVAFRWNNGTLDLFVGGIKDLSPNKSTDSTLTSNTVANSTTNIIFGDILDGSGAPSYWDGGIRKVRFYNIAKSDADIRAMHVLGN